jgi:DNA repair exonuclease SbcCD nuclease subunit
MKLSILSDIHIHPHKNSQQRLDDCLKTLEWVIESSLQRGISNILFLGDLFQDRQKIQVLVYQKTFEIFQKYIGKINWWLLLGNHDLWFSDKHTVSSVFPINAIPGVTVISHPSSTLIGDRWFDWLPYTKNPLKAIETFQERRDRILCAHIALNGCQLHNTHTSEVTVEYEGDMTPVDASYFQDWAKVYLGHYHAHQHVTPTIEYVGSPLQLNFSEANQVKHFIILDTEDLSCEYVENTFSPKHLILHDDELAGVDLLNNYVWIVGDLSKFDAFEINKKLEDKKMRRLEFRTKKFKEEVSHQADTNKALKQFGVGNLETYMKATPHDLLNEELLLKIGNLICVESQEK